MREASELVAELLRQALAGHRFGRLEVILQDGVPTYVREERIHKICQRQDRDPPNDRNQARTGLFVLTAAVAPSTTWL